MTKKLILLVFCMLVASLSATAQMDLVWVGSDAAYNGNWNNRLCWRRVGGGVLNTDYVMSGGEAIPLQSPRSTDNVEFQNSYITIGTVITLDQNSVCRNLNFNSNDDPIASSDFTLRGANTFSLTVHGHMYLIPTLKWEVDGRLIFAAVANGTYDVDFAGKVMRNEVRFDGAAGTGTEWRFLGDLTFATLTGTNAQFLGRLRLLQGTVNTNGYTVKANMIWTHNGNANRRLILGASTVELYGNGVWEPASTTSEVENSTLPIQSDFTVAAQLDAGTSTIILKSPGGSPRFGNNVTLNRVIYDNYAFNSSVNVRVPSGGRINYLEIRANVGNNDATTISGSNTSIVEEMNLYGGRFYAIGNNMTINRISVTAGCGSYATLTGNANTITTTTLPGNPAFTLSSVALRSLTFTRTGSPLRSYVVTDYVDLGGVTWPSGGSLSVTPAVSRTLYWRGGAGNWNDLSKWSSTASGFTAVTCLPTLNDDVVFDASSGGSAFNIVLPQSSPAGATEFYACRNMTWDNAPAGTRIMVDNSLFIYGNAVLQAGCLFRTTTARDVFLAGTGRTVTFNTATFPGRLFLLSGASYTFADNAGMGELMFLRRSTLNTTGITLTATSLYTSGGATVWNMTNTTANLSGTQPYRQYSAHTYTQTGTNIFNFTNTANITILTNDDFDIVTPSVSTTQASSTLFIEDRGRSWTIFGNLVLNGGAVLNGQTNFSTRINFVQVNGNCTFSEGKTYLLPGGVFTGSTLRYFRVNGTFTAKANCQNNAVYVTSANGSITDFFADITDVQFAVMSGIRGNTSTISGLAGGPYVATNSLNIGGNDNWTFPTTVISKTYYWRKRRGTASTHSGNWSNADHWADNPSDTEGDGSCIPTAFDHVVFDNNSFVNTSDRTVTIDDLATCANFTTTYTGVNGNLFSGSQRLIITGSLNLHASTGISGYTGEILFASTAAGRTINTSGLSFANNNIVFDGEGGEWTLQNALNNGTGTIQVNRGVLRSNNHNITTGVFRSIGTSNRSVHLGSSTLTIRNAGVGTLASAAGHALDFSTSTNLTFTQSTGGSIVMQALDARFNGGNMTFERVEFTNAASTNFIYRNALSNATIFNGSGNIFGNNQFALLTLSPGKTYTFESGRTQTFTDDAVLNATGTPSQLITMQATTSGSKAFFFKDKGAPYCFDYIRVRDIEANRGTGNAVEFQTGANSDNVGSTATGVWAFNKPVYIQPNTESGPDQNICKGDFALLSFDFTGRGGYIIRVTGSDGTVVDTTYADGSAVGYMRVNPSATTTYTITTLRSYNCTVLLDGTIGRASQTIHVKPARPVAQNNMQGICQFKNEDTFITLLDNTTERPILSINDKSAPADNSSLGNTTATVFVTPSIQSYNGQFFLPRYFKVNPTTNGPARVRLFITQAELDALSTALGRTVTLAELNVSRFPDASVTQNPATGAITSMNNAGASYLSQTASGTVSTNITTTSNVHWIEFVTPGFSFFFLHASTTLLPVQLLDFRATAEQGMARLHWVTAHERDLEAFVVQRSFDGLTFEDIGDVAGKGGIRNEYQFADRLTRTGLRYYRLKQRDRDQRWTYSSVISLNLAPMEEAWTGIYPNPSTGIFHLRLAPGAEFYVLRVHTHAGREVFGATTREPQYDLDLSTLEKGMYVLSVSDPEGTIRHYKIVVY